MKLQKIWIPLVVAGIGLSTPSFGQIAKRKDLSLEEVYQEINKIAARDDAASKAELAKEALAFSKTKNEKYNLLAASLYNFVGDKKAADAVQKGLSKKYPKGITARNEALKAINDNKEASIDQKLASYKAWLLKFPKDSYDSMDQQIYNQAATGLVKDLIAGGKIQESKQFVAEHKNASEYLNVLNTAANELNKSGHAKDALELLTSEVKNIQSETDKTRTQLTSLSIYAESLLGAGKVTEAIEMASGLIKSSGKSVRPGDVLTLSKAYTKAGRNLDGFKELENYLVKQSSSPEIMKELENQYNSLNANQGDFAAYKASLQAEILVALKNKLKSSMVNTPAHDFKLQNMKGEFVSLADMKGKIVVIDFWATWCGPCIVSFPGMQAAVNKYENDSEVEFLFINTWQTEENYKELVTNFIAENKYSFHVLYDEMKDRANSTVTAYGVTGIPTKVFIDGEGNIRFQSSGGSADVDLVLNEIVAKVELIKEAKKAD